MSDTFVVVGGDAAGMSAASKAKREDPELEVIVFERGEWVSYAACGMPYYVKGEIEHLDDLVAVTPEEFRDERDIDLRTGHEVVDIDPEAGNVTVEGDGETFEQPYDHLLVATGASAIEPPFDGLDLDGVFTIHDMDEADAIDDYVADHSTGSAAIVGGGYVGIEMAEALSARGFDVDLYEMLPHVLQPFGDSVAEVVEDHLREQGVHLHLDTAVSGFDGGGRIERVVLEDGSRPADIAIAGVGVAPATGLAADAGVELGETGAISTNEYGRTNYENVYAAGDCAEARHVVTGESVHVPLALTANRAGRAIGQTVAGDPEPVGETAGTAIVKAFDLGAARTGIVDEVRAREAGFDPVSVSISASSRAHYYPGGGELTVTLVADRATERLLGGTVVGREGAKRIDTVATALTAGMTVSELRNADLAYAPPFSPVWDPVLTAAKVLGGKLDRA
ncbi:NADPH-dependent 2,4-dienoyl-CoA reductase, sulfur reductase [Halopelagius inordinatus]|uniref:NADPH-dependent 2,4-dienoyl-CoA reductase, sulfur reductase n=1 Tax=Halopelagius inordinatus TaxID=553467 RepID=A0A1I2VUM0_9EURY|nr:FAD-dependent oxidoreductase [Halopelagius inordinatus]SFG92944.1 NADPH-dependent 2,4-dienoyl-CoA reductase, sulfur reductase [Halopelagius inordinatus]